MKVKVSPRPKVSLLSVLPAWMAGAGSIFIGITHVGVFVTSAVCLGTILAIVILMAVSIRRLKARIDYQIAAGVSPIIVSAIWNGVKGKLAISREELRFDPHRKGTETIARTSIDYLEFNDLDMRTGVGSKYRGGSDLT